MNMPGFTADATLYKSSGSYRETMAFGRYAGEMIQPANGWLDPRCYQACLDRCGCPDFPKAERNECLAECSPHCRDLCTKPPPPPPPCPLGWWREGSWCCREVIPGRPDCVECCR